MQSSWNLSWTFQNNHKFAQLRLVREIQWISPTHRRLVSVVGGNIGETFSEKNLIKNSIENFFDEFFFRDENMLIEKKTMEKNSDNFFPR